MRKSPFLRKFGKAAEPHSSKPQKNPEKEIDSNHILILGGENFLILNTNNFIGSLVHFLQQINNSTMPNSLPGKRPKLITIFCILGFIGVLPALGGLFNPSTHDLIIQQYGSSFIPITLFIGLLGFIGLVGYWKMRKWGVYAYTTMAVLSIGYALILGISGILGYILPLVVVAVGFANLKKMV